MQLEENSRVKAYLNKDGGAKHPPLKSYRDLKENIDNG